LNQRREPIGGVLELLKVLRTPSHAGGASPAGDGSNYLKASPEPASGFLDLLKSRRP